MNHLIGAHCFTAGGLSTSLLTAKKLNINVIQIFTKNNNQWQAKDIEDTTAKNFINIAREYKITHIFAHSSYLINLASNSDDIFQKSVSSLVNELYRCQKLNIKYLVLHPGSFKNSDYHNGVKNVANAINSIYDANSNITTKILLENTAGQGASIGQKFSQLNDIYQMISYKDKIGFCIDTAHLWAAGYDFVNNYNDVFDEIFSYVGLDNIKLFHLNNSKTDLGSKVDRHEHIKKGKIPLRGFELLLNDRRLAHIPKIIETPKSKDQIEDIENLQILNSLIKQ